MTERRHNRSSQLEAALQMFLDACRLKARAEAIVVADDHGFLVGGAASDQRDLRLEAALLLHPHAKRKSFQVGSIRLHLGTLGLASSAAQRWLDDTVLGVSRILA